MSSVARWYLPLLLLLALRPCGPLAAQEVSVVQSADGVPIHYEVHGSGEPTVVLVHGWANNRRFWNPHTRSLARYHRVVALDLAGFGASGARRTAWTMDRFGQDVAAVVRVLPTSSVILVGFSMGAAAVLEAARLLPERVVGVVLVNAFHDPEAQFDDAAIASMRHSIESTWRNPAAVRQLEFTQQAPDSLISRYLSSTPTTLPEFWWESHADLFRWRSSRLVSLLSDLKVPLVAIHGETPPTNVEAYLRLVPDFSLSLIERVGHLGVLWERPGTFEGELLEAIGRISPR